ncbi:unnamed protein product, partial [Didymodactylos carnosus]
IKLQSDPDENVCGCSDLDGCVDKFDPILWTLTSFYLPTCESPTLKSESGTDVEDGVTLYTDAESQMSLLIASSCLTTSWQVTFEYKAPFNKAQTFSTFVPDSSPSEHSFNITAALKGMIYGDNVTPKWYTSER